MEMVNLRLLACSYSCFDDPSCPSVYKLVRRVSVGLSPSVIISQECGKSHFHASIGALGNFLPKDLMTPPPPPPLGVKNVKIQENSEKIRSPPGGLLGTLYNPF